MAVNEEVRARLDIVSDRHVSDPLLVEGIGVNEPLNTGRLVAIGAFSFALLALVAIPITVARVENTLTSSTETQLAALGVPIEWIDIEFTFRDGRISGELPYHVSPETVLSRVDHPLLGNLDVSASLERREDNQPQDGPLELNASFNGERVTVVGEVLTDEQYDQILAAVAGAAPGAELDDRLEITGLEPAVAGAQERLEDLVTSLEEVGAASQWLIQLTDNSLRVDAGVRTQEVADELESALSGLTAVPSTLEVTVIDRFAPAPRTEASVEEIDALQAELDGLTDEILESVQFLPQRFSLTSEAEVTLDKVIDVLQDHPSPIVEITGHTDTSGDPNTNLALSQRRANAVRAYLASNGIPVQRLRSRGVGSAQPLESNETEEGRAANRRIELRALQTSSEGND